MVAKRVDRFARPPEEAAMTEAPLHTDTGVPLTELSAMQCTVRSAEVSLYPQGVTFGPQAFSCHQLVWVMEGGGYCRRNDGASVSTLAPDTMLLCPPDMPLAYVWDASGPARRASTDFDVTDPYGALSSGSGLPTVFRLPREDIARPLYTHLLWLATSRPTGWQMLRDATLRQLLLVLLSGAVSTGSDEPPVPPAVETALRFVNSEWSRGRLRPLSLCELARASAVSPGHLSRLFRGAFGCPPIELLRLVRLRHAAGLLAQSNLSVTEIGRATGFVATFELSRAFAATYGVSPRTYRRSAVSGVPLPREPLASVRGLNSRLYPHVQGDW
jgi:AraC-like DNA-binding protein